MAHHGGVSLAFGPGSPVETGSPLTLPEGGFVMGVRAEQVEWKNFDQFQPNNKSSFSFFNANMSFGFTPAAMGTFIVPYYVKRQDELGSNKGLSDVKFQLTYGFHHDPGVGFSRNTAEDTAVSLEGKQRTYLAVSFMYSIPTANVHRKLADGSSDPGMQTGFGGAAYTMGISAARAFGAVTLNGEVSADVFTEKDNFQFGPEARVNAAGVYELYGDPGSALSKIDGILELNYLHLGRDREFGEGLSGTGGDILYLSPGMRFSFPGMQNANLGLLVKVPVWKDLNEEQEQQGAEGLEKYRIITTLSFFF
jgi:hypothetical protein